ncbi:white collar one B [Zychaea mexicana]|uniref:white collar one B n=1 Tax=Zychaea mexicana TaxID=64656 RepID=UPI0022FF0A91|nr:white collar one B [Zychaea mexicana]KAI9497896.1 white collar one B [Zychaea mexicana]
MEPLFNGAPFNPQRYGSNNIPQPADRLYSYSGYTAGLMTSNQAGPSGPSAVMSLKQHHQPQHSIPPAQPPLPANSGIMAASVSSAAPTSAGTSIGERYSGMYASTGFDILSVLSRVVNRPNPQINLGPVDLSSSIVVVDARQYDFPIIYASPMFERLTGYAPYEVIGRNCRFLQAPDGCVAMGSRRRYTDNSTVCHIKTHLVQGKESQASIINYKKSGQPFVNLLTVIPVSYEAEEEIDYFVGLQVDLVEQPNLIIQSMKDATYTVNYRNVMIPPYIPLSSSTQQDGQQVVPAQEWTRPPSPKPASSPPPVTEAAEEPVDIEQLIAEASRDNGKYKRCWEELLLEESPDFMHVLTIKGIFLYCSDSIRSILGYEPNELEGKSISTVCHPSDMTTVLRELKQSSNGPSERVYLIYRIRQKNGNYMWIKCVGRLHNEDGRGRKYIVLSGRERPVYQLTTHAASLGRKIQGGSGSASSPSSSDNRSADDHEVWCKLSTDGLLLYASWSCANILGYPPKEITGHSMYQFLKSNRTTDLTRTLAETKEGKIVHLQHTLLNSAGIEISVASTFYPDGSTTCFSEDPGFVLMHIRMAADTQPDQEPMLISLDLDVKKKDRSNNNTDSNSSSNNSIDGSQQQQSTVEPEKMIKELDIKHETNWQYELHQLRISNNKLRESLNEALKKQKEVSRTPVDAICQGCLRRLGGYQEFIECRSQDQPLLCNTCILRRSSDGV